MHLQDTISKKAQANWNIEPHFSADFLRKKLF